MKLDFSQFHPLDHWPGTRDCRRLPGGIGNHLNLAWEFKYRGPVTRPFRWLLWCPRGKHQNLLLVPRRSNRCSMQRLFLRPSPDERRSQVPAEVWATMILAVSGWRQWKDSKIIRRQLQLMADRGYTHFRFGDATGVDLFAWGWVLDFGLPFNRYEANWKMYGDAAGPFRNADMLKGTQEKDVQADLLLAFPQPGVFNAKSSGTWTCAKQAKQLGIPVWMP